MPNARQNFFARGRATARSPRRPDHGSPQKLFAETVRAAKDPKDDDDDGIDKPEPSPHDEYQVFRLGACGRMQRLRIRRGPQDVRRAPYYHYLVEVLSAEQGTLATLRFSDMTVELHGRNLRPCFDALEDERVYSIRQWDSRWGRQDDKAPVIEKILFPPKGKPKEEPKQP